MTIIDNRVHSLEFENNQLKDDVYAQKRINELLKQEIERLRLLCKKYRDGGKNG